MNWYSRQSTTNQNGLFFRRWTRKSYAVFATLGKWVKISVLQASTADRLAAKSYAFLQTVICILFGDEKEEDDSLFIQSGYQSVLNQLIPYSITTDLIEPGHSYDIVRYITLRKKHMLYSRTCAFFMPLFREKLQKKTSLNFLQKRDTTLTWLCQYYFRNYE
ncbi:MAG: hypothetical protein JJU28_06305 [Cyclobacteriaceae bacterium]|nr:hypothetical protein [Cyclobacteriaceae bacterium]